MNQPENPLRPHKLIIPEDDIQRAIAAHVGLDDPQEAHSVYVEAQKGNMVAQFIVGLALQKAGRDEIAQAWLSLSAEQGFGPAKHHLRKAG